MHISLSSVPCVAHFASRAATLGPETQCPYAGLLSAILGRASSPACKGVRGELARFHDHGSRKASTFSYTVFYSMYYTQISLSYTYCFWT